MSRADIRQPRWLAPLCFLCPLVLYALTAARTVQGGDSGEFGLLGLFGGVAHPSGYPLITLLLRAFGTLPINPPFFRVALTSAVCAASASVVIARLVWWLTDSALSALISALAFATCPLIWRLAGVPEVFTLHALLTAIVLLAALEVSEAPTDGRAALLGLAFGLGLSNHLTIVLLAPIVLVAVMRSGRAILIAGVATIIGMTPYLLLLRWSHLDPDRSSVWGSVTTFHALVDHFLRREYGTLQLHAGNQTGVIFSLTFIREFWRELPLQLLVAFFVAALLGIRPLFRRSRGWAWGLMASLFLSGVVFPGFILLPLLPHTLEVGQRFFVLPIVLTIPFVGMGVATLMRRFGATPVGGLAIAALLIGGVINGPRSNWRRDQDIERWIMAAISPLPVKAVMIGDSDTLLSAVKWVQEVDHIRPDVTYVDVTQVAAPWYLDRIRQAIPNLKITQDEAIQPGILLARLAAVRPTYVIPSLVSLARTGGHVEQDGLLDRLSPVPAVVDVNKVRERLTWQSDEIGTLAPPADAWSSRVRTEIAYAWIDLEASLHKLGRDKEATEARQQIERFIPGSADLQRSIDKY